MKDSHSYELHQGDSLNVLREMQENSIDAIVTDPPAGIGFMGKEWDKDKGGRDKWIEWMAGIAAECLRVIKPGGHALVWALPRTSHWTATAWENAGWEPRDRICHIFGSGFPKSANISKQIDRMAGAEREVVSTNPNYRPNSGAIADPKWWQDRSSGLITAPATDAAKQWDGWGTALKPAVEDYWLFRKPIEKGLNIAANVLKWGTGGLNIDGCRIGTAADMNARDFDDSRRSAPKFSGKFNNGQTGQYRKGSGIVPNGRFPANLIHDGSDEVVRLFPQSTSGANPTRRGGMGYHGAEGQESCDAPRGAESGSAARFFYCAKAGKGERDAGLEKLEAVHRSNGNKWTDIDYRVVRGERPPSAESGPRRNVHPTIKPTALMRYLCRLVTPPGGIVLDPFTGSGTTGCAAMLEGFRFIGIERETEYIEIARRRIEYAISHNQVQHPTLFDERER